MFFGEEKPMKLYLTIKLELMLNNAKPIFNTTQIYTVILNTKVSHVSLLHFILVYCW